MADRYILTNGMMAGDTAGKSYDLMGGELKAHVGHKVEITGTLDSAKPSATVTGDPAPPAAGASKLKVISVKMIAAACE